MAESLAVGHWWTLVVRGVIGIVFGVLTFLMPGMALLTLVVLFGLWALVEGLLNVAAALDRTASRGGRRWGLLLAGVAGILAGLIAFLIPGLTALSLLYLIAAWSIVRGVLEIAAAVALRRQLTGEWLYVVAGALSVAFGVLVMAFPGAGALAVVLWIGAYAIAFGVVLIAVGVRVRGRSRSRPPGGGYRDLAPAPGR